MEYIKGGISEWEYVIGLEMHAQVLSNAKLFSSSSTLFGRSPNSQVSLFDAAMPGMLPVLNKYCVEQAIKTALGINADINNISIFDRKNYFYADLPQGYQISQFYSPIAKNGFLDVMTQDGDRKKIRISRIHLEQDAGKSIHDQDLECSLIDLNRAGIALMEIVTEPDISSPFEALDYIRRLRRLLQYIGSCDGNMEKGSIRCDANISVRKRGNTTLGTRCEIKNLNSFKNITKAIEYEGIRQVKLLEEGIDVLQETRLFDVNTGETKTMRSKEDAYDYRYFPDPDLLPVYVDNAYIMQLKNNLPELPDKKVYKYISTLGLNKYDAEALAADVETAKYFEEASTGANAKLIANWMLTELFGRLNKYSIQLSECKVTPGMLRQLVLTIDKGTISGKIGKIVFDEMFNSGQKPDKIIEDKGLRQVEDLQVLETIINTVITNNIDSVAEYRRGKHKLFSFFVGQVMKQTGGKASPQMVNKILKEKLL